MARQIFVNLPVRDLPKSKEFFSSLGFSFEPKFTDDIWELVHMRGAPK